MMTGRMILLTEEESMNLTVRALIPRLCPGAEEFRHWVVISHNGKLDLDRSFPRKIQSWREPGASFIVLRDNDGADCTKLKRALRDRVPESATPVIIRLVCQELESWFLGDLDAVAAAYPQASRHASFRTIGNRDPDSLTNASEILTNLTGTAAKRIRAAAIAEQLDPERNRSKSFAVFMRSVPQGLANLK
jgi:hypothetical protein